MDVDVILNKFWIAKKDLCNLQNLVVIVASCYFRVKDISARPPIF